jgi:hypothetical protein
MEAARSSETFLNFYQTARLYSTLQNDPSIFKDVISTEISYSEQELTL